MLCASTELYFGSWVLTDWCLITLVTCAAVILRLADFIGLCSKVLLQPLVSITSLYLFFLFTFSIPPSPCFPFVCIPPPLSSFFPSPLSLSPLFVFVSWCWPFTWYGCWIPADCYFAFKLSSFSQLSFRYPRWTAKCHFLTACCLEYGPAALFSLPGHIISKLCLKNVDPVILRSNIALNRTNVLAWVFAVSLTTLKAFQNLFQNGITC